MLENRYNEFSGKIKLPSRFFNKIPMMRDVSKKLETSRFLIINRYRRGLETCPQAKTFKSGREYF